MAQWKLTDLGHSGMLRAKLYSMNLTAAFSVHPKSLKRSIMKVHINLFLPIRSCYTQLLDVLNYLTVNLDAGYCIDVINLCRFQKAFNLVLHK